VPIRRKLQECRLYRIDWQGEIADGAPAPDGGQFID
jgi:hypothetical protein